MLNLQKIKELSELKKIPLTKVAERLETSPQALSRMMLENSTKISTLEKLAEIFDVPVGYFFGEQPFAAQAYGDGALAISGNNNITIPHEVLLMLQEKDRQIREKDAIIARLTERLIGK